MEISESKAAFCPWQWKTFRTSSAPDRSAKALVAFPNAGVRHIVRIRHGKKFAFRFLYYFIHRYHPALIRIEINIFNSSVLKQLN